MSDKENYQTTLTESLRQKSLSLPVLRRLVTRLRRSAKRKNAALLLKHEDFNLKVFETQLKTLESLLESDELTIKGFQHLPAYKRRQILTRLENIKGRAERRSDHAAYQAIDFDSQPFHCFGDFEKCMKLKSTNSFWCHFAFYVCVLRSMVPFMK